MKMPAAPPMKRTVYDNFRGVDFAHDAILCDRTRSPYAVNVVSDNGSQPEKRVGFRVLCTLEQPDRKSVV